MLKRDKQHRKLNNKGMTLIEVIITVTILVLVSGFILSAFVSSMRSATKSRELHRATTVAQNIMEGINLKTAEELAFQFNYPYVLDSTGARIDNFNVYPSTMFQYQTEYSVGELMAWTDPSGATALEVVDTSRTLAEYNLLTDTYEIAKTKSAYLSDITTKNYDFLKDQDGKYVYYLRNLESDGAYYNAKITLDASEYRSGGLSGIDINSEKLISIPTIDSSYDAVEVMKDNLDEEAIADLQAMNPGVPISLNNLHRVITITIEDALIAGPEGLHRTKVSADYEYYFEKADGTPSAPYQGSSSIAFNNEGNEDIKQLRNIYLYYYPMYKAGTNTDTIVINNMNNVDVELYVIKQENGLAHPDLTSKEQSYRVSFNVKESTTNASGDSHIELHTNWNENLAAIYSAIPMPAINQVDFRRNSLPVAKEMFNTTDIKNKKESDRMYKVTVEIYESKKSDDFSAFSTSTNVADWFNPDNHLITMTSSISQ